MRSDSPSPSWYEPPDLEDVEHDDVAESDEVLAIGAGTVSWYVLIDDDDDA